MNCFYGIENLFSNNYYHGNCLEIAPRNEDEGIEHFATETSQFINEVTQKKATFFLVSRKPPNPAGFLGAYLHVEKGHKIREIRHY